MDNANLLNCSLETPSLLIAPSIHYSIFCPFLPLLPYFILLSSFSLSLSSSFSLPPFLIPSLSSLSCFLPPFPLPLIFSLSLFYLSSFLHATSILSQSMLHDPSYSPIFLSILSSLFSSPPSLSSSVSPSHSLCAFLIHILQCILTVTTTACYYCNFSLHLKQRPHTWEGVRLR